MLFFILHLSKFNIIGLSVVDRTFTSSCDTVISIFHYFLMLCNPINYLVKTSEHAHKSFTARKRKNAGIEDSCVYTGGCVCVCCESMLAFRDGEC